VRDVGGSEDLNGLAERAAEQIDCDSGEALAISSGELQRAFEIMPEMLELWRAARDVRKHGVLILSCVASMDARGDCAGPARARVNR